ncbi:siphovirus Gp157 family protein [uncultured Sutterella sp.]|uniref:siphovirus Gp157 family protein n=1 Tax=uncultured Sutterella sp. TaxID=286133 RepID=UPI00266FF1BC|nr:siphovirus Gp157 family protein [uncultured Sutterella sp.]
MKIYEIPSTLRDLLDRLDADPDTGEVDGDALAAYAEYQGAATEKLEATACYVRELEAEAEAIKAEEDRLAKRRKALEGKAARLKTYLMPALEAVGGKVKGVMASLRISRTQAVYVFDLDALPDAFKRVKTTIDPDKVALKKALKSGEVIPGAALEDRQSVVIS